MDAGQPDEILFRDCVKAALSHPPISDEDFDSYIRGMRQDFKDEGRISAHRRGAYMALMTAGEQVPAHRLPALAVSMVAAVYMVEMGSERLPGRRARYRLALTDILCDALDAEEQFYDRVEGMIKAAEGPLS